MTIYIYNDQFSFITEAVLISAMAGIGLALIKIDYKVILA